MKKNLNSLPSTKPDHFFKSQGSELGFLTNRKQSYQTQIASLIQSMTKILESRLFFLKRDIEVIYRENETLIKDLLLTGSGEQLWNFLVPKYKEEISEEGQIKLLVRLLEVLNERKMAQGDLGNVEKADKLRKTISWMIPQIVKYEEHYLDQQEKEHVTQWEVLRNHRLTNFEKNQHKTIEQFQRNDRNRQQSLLNRFSIERRSREQQFKEKVQRQIYKVNPSQKLRQTKEKSLLRKLGPYRLNKMNPYQDEGYTKDIYEAVEAQQTRKMRLIEHLKRKQHQKIIREHNKTNQSQHMHAQHERQKMLSSLSFEKTTLGHYQQKTKDNMLHHLRLQRNKKLTELKKTLEAFVKHEDSEKIKEILLGHEEKIRHNNDILQVAATQAQVKAIAGRYSTLNPDRSDTVNLQITRQKKEFERKIRRLFEQKQPEKHDLSFSGRKSLVDLYDKSMELL